MKYLLCHGLGETPEQWRAVTDRLSVPADCPALFDLVREGTLTYGKLYAAFERFCDSQDGPLHLCGLSLGGVLALNYASGHKERVESLVLIGTPYKIPPFAFAMQNILFHLMPKRVFLSMGLAKKDAISLMQSMSRLDIPRMAAGITCRTLILCGEKDTANSDGSAALHREIAHSRLAVIGNARHQVNLDAPAELSEELQSFWAEDPRSP